MDLPIDWSLFADAQILIERRNKVGVDGLGGPIWGDPISVWSGGANVFDKTSNVGTVPAGEIAFEQITAIVDPTTSGFLPEIQKGDRLTVLNTTDGTPSHKYLITHAHLWAFGPQSIEIEATNQKTW